MSKATPDFGPRDFTDSEYLLWASADGFVAAAANVCAVRGLIHFSSEDMLEIGKAMIEMARERVRREREAIHNALSPHVIRARLRAVLSRQSGLCCDDEGDRERLADALLAAFDIRTHEGAR